MKTITIEEGALFATGFFVVLEDGSLLFTDIRDKNNQIKLFRDFNGVLADKDFVGVLYVNRQAITPSYSSKHLRVGNPALRISYQGSKNG